MNDHLRADLDSGANVYDLPPADLDRVVKRARQRDRRRHRLTGSVAAVALLAGTFAAVQVANHDPKTKVASDAIAAHLGDAGIDWQRAGDPASTIAGWQQDMAEVGGQTYALSTAPGQAAADQPQPKVVWRSGDGLEWSQASTPDGLYVSDLAAGENQLYAIGTGPATSVTSGGRAVPEVRVGWSADGTANWQQQALPLDLQAIAAKATSVSARPVGVAVGANGVVAVVAVSAELDVPRLLPAGETAPHGWAITADGVDVLADGPECPAGMTIESPKGSLDSPRKASDTTSAVGRQYASYCFSPDGTGRSVEPTESRGVVAHHTWSDLHVDGDLLRAVQNQPFMFRADPGKAGFERTDVVNGATVSGGVGGAVVHADASGFTLVLASSQGTKDGFAEQVVLRSPDGRTWQEEAGALAGVDTVLAMGTVNGHLAVVGGGRSGGIYAELRPEGWQTTSLSQLLGVPDSGAVDTKSSWPSAAAIGPLGVVIGVTDATGDNSNSSVLASRDGSTWSRTSVDQLVGGRSSGVQRIVIKDDRAVATVSLPNPDGKTSRQVSVVGTPR
ncbi:MAG: hypothetical protein JWN29_551 [Acidimicrobiales bacterium]|nr:hypothetical protein [Acidimicrobiales bacterium]